MISPPKTGPLGEDQSTDPKEDAIDDEARRVPPKEQLQSSTRLFSSVIGSTPSPGVEATSTQSLIDVSGPSVHETETRARGMNFEDHISNSVHGSGISEGPLTNSDTLNSVEPGEPHDAKSGFRYERSFGREDKYSHITLSADCSILAAAAGSKVIIYRVTDGKSLASFRINDYRFWIRMSACPIKKLAILSVQHHVVVLQTDDSRVGLWDWTDYRSPIVEKPCHDGAWACYDPAGLIAILGPKGLFDYTYTTKVKYGKVTKALDGGNSKTLVPGLLASRPCAILSYSQDARWIVAGFDGGYLVAYDRIAHASKLHTPERVSRYPLAIAFDGHTIVSAWSSKRPVQSGEGDLDHMILWTIGTSFARIVDFHFHPESPRFSLDGRLYCYVLGAYVHLSDRNTGEVVWTERILQRGFAITIGETSRNEMIAVTGRSHRSSERIHIYMKDSQ